MKRACFSLLVVLFLLFDTAYGDPLSLLFRESGKEMTPVMDATSPLSARRSLMFMALSVKDEAEFQVFCRQRLLLDSVLRDCSEKDFEVFRKMYDRKGVSEIFPAVRRMDTSAEGMFAMLWESSEEDLPGEPVSRESLQKEWSALERVIENLKQNKAVFDATSRDTLADSLARMSFQAETDEQFYALFSLACAYNRMLVTEDVDHDDLLMYLRENFQNLALIPFLEKSNQQSEERIIDKLYRIYRELPAEEKSAFREYQKKYLANVIEVALEEELQNEDHE